MPKSRQIKAILEAVAITEQKAKETKQKVIEYEVGHLEIEHRVYDVITLANWKNIETCEFHLKCFVQPRARNVNLDTYWETNYLGLSMFDQVMKGNYIADREDCKEEIVVFEYNVDDDFVVDSDSVWETDEDDKEEKLAEHTSRALAYFCDLLKVHSPVLAIPFPGEEESHSVLLEEYNFLVDLRPKTIVHQTYEKKKRGYKHQYTLSFTNVPGIEFVLWTSLEYDPVLCVVCFNKA